MGSITGEMKRKYCSKCGRSCCYLDFENRGEPTSYIPDTRTYELRCLNCNKVIDSFIVDNTINAVKELYDKLDETYGSHETWPIWSVRSQKRGDEMKGIWQLCKVGWQALNWRYRLWLVFILIELLTVLSIVIFVLWFSPSPPLPIYHTIPGIKQHVKFVKG